MENETLSTAHMKKFTTDGTPDAVVARYARLKEDARHAQYGALDEDVVVVDTETTGVSFNHDELTQIAAARMRKGKIVDWFVTFVNPGKPIPDEIAHLTNIHDADVAEAPTPSEACAQLAEFVGTSNLVAHNSAFDKTFTTKNAGGATLANNVWIDSLDLARIALPRLKSHRLIDLVHAFDAPVSTHRADADVEATCAVYRILLAGIAAMPDELVSYIAGLASVEDWPTVRVFEHFAFGDAYSAASDACDAAHFADRAGEDDAANSDAALSKTTAPDAAGTPDWVDQALAVMKTETTPEKPSQDVLCEEGEKTRTTTASVDFRALRRARTRRELRSMPKVDARTITDDPTRALCIPSKEEVENAFTPNGLVGSLYATYEQRAEQVAMATAVRDAFASSTNLAVEAGTGVGKSMAYLAPAALMAQRNNISVGVATKTNALLDQLVNKELPLLSKALEQQTGTPLTYAPLKGFSHYLCLRRVENVVHAGARMKEVAGKEISQAPAIAGVLSYIEQTEYDDIDTLKVDYRTLPRYLITTNSTDCLRRKCPYFGTACFVHGARERANAADVVVTNHSLLFCDVAADGGLLPPVRYWVVDEAHGAEVEARRALSPEISADALLRQARRLAAGSGNTVFHRIEMAAARTQDDSSLVYGLSAKAKSAGADMAAAAAEFAHHFKDLLYFDHNRRSKGYEYVEIWLNDDVRGSEHFAALASHASAYYDAAEKFVKAGQELVVALEDIEHAAVPQRELASLVVETKDFMTAAEVIFFNPSERYAYAARLSKKPDNPNDLLQALLVNVGLELNERFFERTNSVVFASATLSISDDFTSFENALGLNRSEQSTTRTLQLPSSYDFDRNMTIYVVDDMPEPNAPQYLSALQDLLIGVHRAQRGSMLTLFTNRKEMESCFNVVQPALKEDDLRLVCQKWGLSIKGLRDDFLADHHLSLFALKSFWEGFDAPGATLRGVVIPKLPFGKPSDPLSCERGARDDKAWSHYVLPAAVIETKQAAGRLIRSASDTGVLIFADKRLVTKGYGRVFLRSMPSKTVKFVKTKELISLLEAGLGA